MRSWYFSCSSFDRSANHGHRVRSIGKSPQFWVGSIRKDSRQVRRPRESENNFVTAKDQNVFLSRRCRWRLSGRRPWTGYICNLETHLFFRETDEHLAVTGCIGVCVVFKVASSFSFDATLSDLVAHPNIRRAEALNPVSLRRDWMGASSSRSTMRSLLLVSVASHVPTI